MGIKWFSSSSYETNGMNSTTDNKLPNPDPNNYNIVESKQIDNFLVLKVNYPDCINYEGNKILVFENISLDDIINQNSLDPHFSDTTKYHTPIARFEPTDRGFYLACWFCKKVLSA
jgi:hypothetical protein